MAKDEGELRAARVVSLLEDSVRTELQVINRALELGLGDATIEQLTSGVTSGVLSAFSVDWSPDWVKPGQVHAWEENGAFFARCSDGHLRPHMRTILPPAVQCPEPECLEPQLCQSSYGLGKAAGSQAAKDAAPRRVARPNDKIIARAFDR
ncbi:hypothetical protein [Phytohabitans suffuscus]|uniref:Uncharacterized protein n=1 Tax=Phytohabitans suffuscus TaxID=624315 RepID=A0A6F8YRT8_9ACTN|nr:hypothetical protein [Phytohabitans suffuscus]BCB88703.1 hypothetical protein Psuf_060160 [Phytohabitans suffuscus]